MTITNRLLELVPVQQGEPLTRRDFASDQEVRWCPGCGDYAILTAVQAFLPELGVPRENLVFVSGIGCSSRFPYYLDCYGLHSIHGRAPAIATGLAVTRRDLSVWVVTGDGDALSIGGNHLMHALRRNVNITVLLVNNQVYGLTKGQYSPTSPRGTVSGSTPRGSLEAPFNPVALALAAEATFVARTLDSDREHLTEVLRRAAAHPGAALVEIYQNCPVFNDGVFASLKDPVRRDANALVLRQGEPLLFAGGGVRRSGVGGVEVCSPDDPDVLVWDATEPDPSTAFALSRLSGPTPIGVFRDVDQPSYDELLAEQVAADRPSDATLDEVLRGPETWTS